MNRPSRTRLRAPEGDGECLFEPGFSAVAELLRENQRRLNSRDARFGSTLLASFREDTRKELTATFRLPSTSGPWIVTGHQPELCHPGVWLKTFAAAGLAERFRGIAVNLIVDTDELKSNSLAFPRFSLTPESVIRESVTVTSGPTDRAYISVLIDDDSEFAKVPDRVESIAKSWPFVPLIRKAWSHMTKGNLGERYMAARECFERDWGCEVPGIPVSALSKTKSFHQFTRLILDGLPRFISVHNDAVRDYRRVNRLHSRTHPVPELQTGEAPFWSLQDGRRRPATIDTDPATLIPRALTLTMFARLAIGDWFIHGLGGGKYDVVTDAIIRNFFNFEPPSYQIVTGTLRLPFPTFPHSNIDVERLKRQLRALQWNPQQFVDAGTADVLVNQRIAMNFAKAETKLQRRERANAIRSLNERMRPLVDGERKRIERALGTAITEWNANAILRSRESAWVLFPEAAIKPFLQSAQLQARRE